jgi:hypothetical protein
MREKLANILTDFPFRGARYVMSVRSARLLPALLFAGSLAVTPLRAQRVEYAAGTIRYRVSTTTKGIQTSSRGDANFEANVTEQLTVNIMKHARDTVIAILTLDSITIRSAGPKPDLSKLMGARFVSLVSPTGRFYSTTGPVDIDPQLAPIADGVARFLPTFRGELAPGATWTDSLSDKDTQQGIQLDRITVSHFSVSGDTTIGGEKALTIKRVTSIRGTGKGNIQGTPVALETVNRNTGTLFLTPGGAYLGGTLDDDVNVKLTIIAQNEQINIKQSVQTKIDAIR